MPDYPSILQSIHGEILAERPEGKLATYIPGLAKVAPDQFGICLHTASGEDFLAGDSEVPFSIQSITKVLLLAMLASTEGDSIWQRVGVEPSGNPFNSLVQLEYEKGIPRNPFINAGALVVCDLLLGLYDDPESNFLKFVQRISGIPEIHYDRSVAKSEREVAYRNLALLNLMKDFGNIHQDVDAIIRFYCTACSISMSCRHLARTFALFMNHGILDGGEEILSINKAKRINALMQTCGFYDESGEFAFRVGLPGKSGVGGGIAAVHPGRYSVAVWSPPLNPKGNSAAGLRALERLTDLTGNSIF
ncbi:glutaminase [Haloferula chungangensis]|uniref:Glutaminase n=1 Tax=Haloferula chungangensis TaxID=1048331 RepID=A0ABW2L4P1_9BACT